MSERNKVREVARSCLRNVLWIGILTATFNYKVVQPSQQEKQLYSQLLQGYNKLVRPVKRTTDTVTVRLRFSLVDVIAVDENNGHISVKVWISMYWKDEYLTWNPELHGGIKRLNFLTEGNSRIWTPDITVFNALKTALDPNIQAVVAPDGKVVWIQPGVYTVRCRHEFRGNSWVSAFKVGSWTYNDQAVDILPAADRPDDAAAAVDIDTESYTANDYWAMLEHGGRRDVRVPQGGGGGGGCCHQQSFVSMYYILKLRKKLGPSLLG